MANVTPYTDITDPRVAKALAHPLRIKILSTLEGRTASPSEIADEVGAPLTNVSYHMRHLHRLGVIKLVRRTVRGGTVQHHYRAEVRPRVTDDTWGQLPEIVRQAASGVLLERIAETVSAAARAGGFARDEVHVSRVPMLLDGEGWAEASQALAELRERLAEIEQRSEQRIQAGESPEHEHVTAVLMLFETAAQDTTSGTGRSARRGAARSRSRSAQES